MSMSSDGIASYYNFINLQLVVMVVFEAKGNSSETEGLFKEAVRFE